MMFVMYFSKDTHVKSDTFSIHITISDNRKDCELFKTHKKWGKKGVKIYTMVDWQNNKKE